jgi:hypothetical protein
VGEGQRFLVDAFSTANHDFSGQVLRDCKRLAYAARHPDMFGGDGLIAGDDHWQPAVGDGFGPYLERDSPKYHDIAGRFCAKPSFVLRNIKRFSVHATMRLMGLVIEGLRSCHKSKPCDSMRSKLRFMAAALVFGAAFFVSANAEDFGPRYQAIVDSKGKASDSERLQELFKVDWAYTMAVSPEYATYLGVPGYDTKWTDLSHAAIAERRQLTGRPLTVLATIDSAHAAVGHSTGRSPAF